MSQSGYWSSSTLVSDNVVACSSAVLEETLGAVDRAVCIDKLGKLASSLEAFVNGYLRIVDPTIDTDDEILNWTFGETQTDLCAAIWLLASGYYKASASCVRNAYDIAVASLYFQIRQNEHKLPGYNKFFAEWDSGKRGTPNWGEMKTTIGNQETVLKFVASTGVDPIDVAYAHFKYLCAYTHTAAFAGPDDPVTAINMTGVAPAFDAQFFTRGCETIGTTISMIAVLWQVVFPAIAKTEPLGPISGGGYNKLFSLPHGPAALSQ
jgi:hypothetical protein